MVCPPRVLGREGAGLRATAAAAGQVAKIRTVKGSGCRSARKRLKPVDDYYGSVSGTTGEPHEVGDTAVSGLLEPPVVLCGNFGPAGQELERGGRAPVDQYG